MMTHSEQDVRPPYPPPFFHVYASGSFARALSPFHFYEEYLLLTTVGLEFYRQSSDCRVEILDEMKKCTSFYHKYHYENSNFKTDVNESSLNKEFNVVDAPFLPIPGNLVKESINTSIYFVAFAIKILVIHQLTRLLQLLTSWLMYL